MTVDGEKLFSVAKHTQKSIPNERDRPPAQKIDVPGVRTGARPVVKLNQAIAALAIGTSWLLPVALISSSPLSASTGRIGGTVFRDLNANGVRDVGESNATGVFIKVAAHNAGPDGTLGTGDDAIPSIVVAAPTGTWSVDISSDSNDVAVSLEGIDQNKNRILDAGEDRLTLGFGAARRGVDNQGLVQIVPLGSTDVRMGIQNESDPCQGARFALTCFTRGDNPVFNDSLVEIDTMIPGSKTPLADAQTIGAAYGVAARSDNVVFTASSVKRHTRYGLAQKNNEIYQTYTDGTGASTTRPFVQLKGILPDHEPENDVSDDNVWEFVGHRGIGDIDLSDDGKTLYAVNLGTRTLDTVALSGSYAAVSVASPPASIAIPVPAGCLDPQPSGLGVSDGLVYVGGVCTAESTTSGGGSVGSTTDLRAYIFAFNPSPSTDRQVPGHSIRANTFSALPIVDFRLDYPRTCGGYAAPGTGSCGDQVNWGVWQNTTTLTHQPMLTNISVDRGDLLISLRDRTGDMIGYQTEIFGSNAVTPEFASAGDLLLACRGENGFVVESNGVCPSFVNGSRTGTVANSEGPGGGEFFGGDRSSLLLSGQRNETLEGSTAVAQGKVFATANHVASWADQGVVAMSTSNGDFVSAHRVVSAPPIDQYSFSLSNGVGDIERLCDAAPTEIAYRVWLDYFVNGRQDAGEPGYAGLRVELRDGATVIASATTNANGEARFSSVASPGATTVPTLAPYTSYTIAAARVIGAAPTYANQASSTLDSNEHGLADPASWTTPVTTGNGTTTEDVDLGLIPVYSLGNRVFEDVTGNGLTADDIGLADIEVELLDAAGNQIDMVPVLPGLQPAITRTDAQGYYRFDGLYTGRYSVRINSVNFAPGGPIRFWRPISPGTGTDADHDGNLPNLTDYSTVEANGMRTDFIDIGLNLSGTGPIFHGEPTGETDLSPTDPGPHGDSNADLTVDFGFRRPIDLSVSMVPSNPNPVPGEVVRFDISVTNAAVCGSRPCATATNVFFQIGGGPGGIGWATLLPGQTLTPAFSQSMPAGPATIAVHLIRVDNPDIDNYPNDNPTLTPLATQADTTLQYGFNTHDDEAFFLFDPTATTTTSTTSTSTSTTTTTTSTLVSPTLSLAASTTGVPSTATPTTTAITTTPQPTVLLDPAAFVPVSIPASAPPAIPSTTAVTTSVASVRPTTLPVTTRDFVVQRSTGPTTNPIVPVNTPESVPADGAAVATAPPRVAIDVPEGSVVQGTAAPDSSGTMCFTLFADSNGNGRKDPGEPPLVDVSVRITGPAGNATITRTQPTDTDGRTCFASLPQGDYLVEFLGPFHQQTLYPDGKKRRPVAATVNGASVQPDSTSPPILAFAGFDPRLFYAGLGSLLLGVVVTLGARRQRNVHAVIPPSTTNSDPVE